MSFLENIAVDVSLNGNRLTANIKSADSSSEKKYYFYMIRNGEVIDKQGWFSENTYEWELAGSGVYSVQGYMKTNIKKEHALSSQITYIDMNINIIGSKGIKDLCKKMFVSLSNIEYEITVIDCLGFVENVIDAKIPMKEMVDNVRKETEITISNCGGVTYWLLYDFSKVETLNDKINWLLEECYDVLRRHNNTKIKAHSIMVNDVHIINDISDFNKYIFDTNFLSVFEEIKIENTCSNILKCPSISISNGYIHVEAELKKEFPGDLFAFYLMRDGKVINKTSYGYDRSIDWQVCESGVYNAYAFCKRLNRVTKRATLSVYYSTEEDNSEYWKFLKKDAPKTIFSKELSYTPLYGNYCDILVVSKKDKNENFTRIENLELQRVIKVGEKNAYLYCDKRAVIYKGNQLICFSGRIFHGDKYLYGAKDVEKDGIIDFECSIGHFSSVIINNNTISFYNDVFSFNRWYYYDTEYLTVVTNNYHLLLVTLYNCGICLELDYNKAKITLSTAKLQILSQNFTKKMDMKECYQVPFYKKIIIDSKGFNIANNAVFEILNSRDTYHEIIYKSKKTNVIKELIHNFASILKDVNHDEITVDLTGGLDSRVMYGILSNIPNTKDSVKINTHAVPNSNDLPCAITLNEIYNFSFNDYSEIVEIIPLREADQLNRSFYMGTYYSKTMCRQKCHSFNRMELTGACGEILFRPYIARHFLTDDFINTTEIDEFTSNVFDKYADSMIVDCQDIKNIFVSYFSNELSDIPGNTLLEKLDRHYLGFRHGYHFDTIQDRLGYNHIMPLQSLELLDLHHYSFDSHRSIRLQLDIIKDINPILFTVKFDDDKDNTDSERLLKLAYVINKKKLNTNTDEWERFEKTRKENRTVICNDDINRDDNTYNNHIKKGLLNHFHILMNLCPQLSNTVGPALFHRFQVINENSTELAYWYNKISSLMDQCLIFDNSSKAEIKQRRNITFSIWGSCVTRDLFEYEKDDRFILDQYVARESLVSAVSLPLEKQDIGITLDSNFQKQMVEMDIFKKSFEFLREEKSDYLIIDLIDERFPLISFEESYFTASNEAIKGCDWFQGLDKLYKRIIDGKLYVEDNDVDGYIDVFCQKINEIYSNDRIIIHRALLVDYYIDKDLKIAEFDKNHIINNKRLNSILNYMYDSLIEKLPGAAVIDEMKETKADESHKWGLAPMHYQESYYLRVLKRMDEITREAKG